MRPAAAVLLSSLLAAARGLSVPAPRPRIAVVDSFTADQGDRALWSGLRQAFDEVAVYPRSAPANALVDARVRGYEAIITNKVVLSAADLAALKADGLEYVGIAATGMNAVDLDAAASLGIAVTNVPAYSTASVAQHVAACLLDDASAVAEHGASVGQGAWEACPDFSYLARPTRELAGKTLLVVGSGATGSAVAAVAEALGMRVVFGAVPGRERRRRFSSLRSLLPPARRARRPLREALPEADYVSLHCPLSPQTADLGPC